MSKRTIKAVFEISEDYDLAGVHFICGRKKIKWEELTKMEQIRMLNAWGSHWQLFERFLKEE